MNGSNLIFEPMAMRTCSTVENLVQKEYLVFRKVVHQSSPASVLRCLAPLPIIQGLLHSEEPVDVLHCGLPEF